MSTIIGLLTAVILILILLFAYIMSSKSAIESILKKQMDNR